VGLGILDLHPRLVSEIDRRTGSVECSTSRSDHRSPAGSPRRHPVVAATESVEAMSGSICSTEVINRL